MRTLKANEIDARVSTVTDKGCSLLLYKDARVDMNILDETYGPNGWKRTHQLIGDRLYCTVEIYDEKRGWIAKQDVGTESYTEKEKGQASDSFKRACFNVGIGRELYSAPFIWIQNGNVNIKEKNGKYTTYDRFKVTRIEYDEERNISSLEIENITLKAVVYKFGFVEETYNDILAELKGLCTDDQFAACMKEIVKMKDLDEKTKKVKGYVEAMKKRNEAEGKN